MEDEKKILVVEDSSLQREVCVDQLRDIGFNNVFEAENGIAALEILKKNSIDLILSDWDMPQMDGLELLKTVKQDSNLQNTPFIFLTVHDNQEKNKEGMVYGAVDYIVKPSSPSDLKESIEIIFKRGIRNILIVEDSDLQREICIVQLQQIGFEKIMGAANGVEALNYMEDNPVDIKEKTKDMSCDESYSTEVEPCERSLSRISAVSDITIAIEDTADEHEDDISDNTLEEISAL